MKHFNWIKASGLALVLTGVLTTSAMAQRQRPSREERQQDRDQRREQLQNMTEEQRQQYFQQRWQERLNNMTPEQRQRWEQRRQQRQQQGGRGGGNAAGGNMAMGGAVDEAAGAAQMSVEDAQRALLNSALITDRATQDAIIAFVDAQAKRRAALTVKAQAISGALAAENIAPERITTLLAELRQATAQDKIQNEAALQQLDAQIKYTTTPRLEAFLTLIGILGEDANVVGGFGAIFPTGLAGGPEAQAALAAAGQ